MLADPVDVGRKRRAERVYGVLERIARRAKDEVEPREKRRDVRPLNIVDNNRRDSFVERSGVLDLPRADFRGGGMRREQKDDRVGFLDQLLQPILPLFGRQDVVGVLEDAKAPGAEDVGDGLRALAILARIGEEDLSLLIARQRVVDIRDLSHAPLRGSE